MHVRNDGSFVGGKKVLGESESGYYIEDRASKIYKMDLRCKGKLGVE